MPLLMVIGMATDRPVDGAIAAGAAFSVGFGAARELRGRRWGAMGAATLGMACAAFLGCLLGQSTPLFIVVAAMAAALCAATALKDEDAWWVILQLVIAFLVAGSYPGTIGAAGHRALVVLLGGVVQIGTVMLLAGLFPAAAAPVIVPAPRTRETGILCAHMLRAAICVAAGLLIARHLTLTNVYWAPMTALIVLKPRLHETGIRGLARLTGTLAGSCLATLYAHVCRDAPGMLILGMAVTATASFALQKAHYASLTTAITATVVLLLTLGQSSALANAEHRLVATLLGGVIALGVAWVVPHQAPLRLARADRVGLAGS
jgi:uncharacterized membrane protein YgaE (UPF0421/DUF939 family)